MSLWEKTKEILKDKIPASSYSLWIEPLVLVKNDGPIVELAGPDRFFNSWVSEKFLTNIRECFAIAGKSDARITLSVMNSEKDEQGFPPQKDSQREQLLLPEIVQGNSNIRTLHPKYTFDEFMVGDTNILAHNACRAIANNDDTVSRCLFINAGTGLGKSHLSHSVAHHVYNFSPATRIQFRTAQQLTAEMVRGIKSNTMEQFKDRYQKFCDVLLIEDVQSLAGRVKTQSELSEMVDVLLERDKRIIFTSSMPANQIPNIDSSFRSRLSSGLITTINPPDLKTRTLIIKRKARNYRLDLSDEAVNYLAETVKGDIRLIESAIVGIRAKASILGITPDLDMIKEVISDIIGRAQSLTVEVIRDFIAGQFNVPVNDLMSKSRKKTVAFPRQVTMYLARKLTDHGLTDIGKAFNRDHSTVVHSIKVVTETMARNGSVRGQVDHLSKKIKQQFL